MERNVVVLCLDSVRKDFFDCYAPRIRERAVSFDGCRAASSWSTPSHASMFTGLLPSAHGVHVHDKEFSGLEPADSFLADLPEHETVGVSANVFASSKFGFDGLFDRFREVSTGCRFPDGLDPNAFYIDSDRDGFGLYLEYLRSVLTADHPIKSLANGLLAGVNIASRDAPVPKLLDDGAAIIAREVREAVTGSPEPTFVFTNFGDAHVPLRSIRGYDRTLFDSPHDWSTDDVDVWDAMADPEAHERYFHRHRALYGAAIDYLDRKLLALMDDLHERTDRETTFVVTADHGENLGYSAEDRLLGHKSSLSEALLHVPLAVVNPPPGYPDRVERLVSHLRLGELVVGLARGETPDVTDDRVAGEVVGMSPGPDPPADVDREHWDRALRCAYGGDEKYVWDSLGRRERYAVDSDRPCWQRHTGTDVAVPEWATDFFDEEIAAYRERVAVADRGDPDVDVATERRLEDLGYL